MIESIQERFLFDPNTKKRIQLKGYKVGPADYRYLLTTIYPKKTVNNIKSNTCERIAGSSSEELNISLDECCKRYFKQGYIQEIHNEE